MPIEFSIVARFYAFKSGGLEMQTEEADRTFFGKCIYTQ